MKKRTILALLLTLVLVVAAGCGEKKTNQESKTSEETAVTETSTKSEETETETEKIKIGILQYMEHGSLDQAREGFEDGLKEQGIDAEIVYQNAQGDVNNSNLIAQNLLKEDVALILAIATPSAQSAQKATTEIPILFTAVTDPAEAGLLKDPEAPEGNITGTSDAQPIQEQLQILTQMNPEIKKIGVLYNTSEPNSAVQLKQAQEIAATIELEIVEKGVSTLNELPMAMDALFPNVDAVYLITDNMVANAIELVNTKLIEYKLPSSTAFEAAVNSGILVSKGLNYYNLGKQTAEQAKKILVDKTAIAEIPVETSTNAEVLINKKTAEILGYDLTKAPFADAKIVE
jgi:putative ABC transport system substrate-binding protein